MADPKKDQRKQAAKQAAKEEKALKKQQRKQSRQQVWQAFKMQSKNDKKLIPLMLLSIIGVAVVFFLIGMLFNGQWFMLPLGLVLGFALAMYIFTKRVENTVYDRAEGQAGAAGWALENLRSGPGVEWHTKTAVATNHHMDAVHRVIGSAGVVLVGEGELNRVRPLLNRYKRNLSRIASQIPIYEIYAGEGEGQVRVRNLQKELLKLPRNYKKKEIPALAAKIESMDRNPLQAAGMPGGPMPKAASMAGMNRRARRAQQRRKG